MEMNKKKYTLIRKGIKGIIIIFWILLLLIPLISIINEVGADCWIEENSSVIIDFNISVKTNYLIWGNFSTFSKIFTQYTIIHPIFYFALILFWIGFFLSFGNIKRDYKNQIINKNLGYISGLLILLGIIGITASAMGSSIGFTHPSISIIYMITRVEFNFEFYSGILMLILIFGETMFLNRVRIIEEETKIVIIKNNEVPRVIYCSGCGIEILDKSKKFCSECGAKISN